MPEKILVELEHEPDGRWLADAVNVPGVMAYGDTRWDALCNVAVKYAGRVIRIKAQEVEPWRG